MTTSQEWHIITCEYPPQPGGVSDYTWLVAKGLAAEGDRVHVWCPSSAAPPPPSPGVTVHRELGAMKSADLRRVGRRLDEFPTPRRLLVQWVPHGYGYRSMNLPFCLWLWKRGRVSADEIEIMVHEPFLAFGEGSWKQDAAAAVHRIMIAMVLNASSRVWVTIPTWRTRLRPYLFGRSIRMDWLPVPSSVEFGLNPTEEFTSGDRSNRVTLGHFGTYGRPVVEMLEAMIRQLLRDNSNRALVLMGRGSKEFRSRIISQNPELNEKVYATGAITTSELSSWMRKCDVMVQPYPDGVSGRRTTAMAALSHGLPMVTTAGALTEPVWAQSEAAALVPAGNVPLFLAAVDDLIADATKRTAMALRARKLYMERFDIRHTIHQLRSSREMQVPCES
jgi:glycosyltransferase involved in cell wall biosynthesis